MPHLRFRALKSEHVAVLSSSLAEELAPVMQTSADNFTFEHIPSQYFEKGKASNAFPFVEVLWFARSQEIQDQSAQILTERVQNVSGAVDVSVIFLELKPAAYYDNGKHF